jgi:hypothetical protein
MDFQGLIIVICLAVFPVAAPPVQGDFFQASGIRGRVFMVSGNQMPSPRHHSGPPPAADSASPPANGPGVKATICIFDLTNDSQVVRQGTSPWCQEVHTRLIKQENTDDHGNFSILLPPGTYSVFTKKRALFYASRRDDKNNIATVEVLPGKMTRVDCRVESDHKVVY